MTSEKKYELTDDAITTGDGTTLRRIRALRDIPGAGVRAGDLGGYIGSEGNLSHAGDAWVSDNARVWGDARVSGNARVWGYARVWDDARVSGDAQVSGHAWVSGSAFVSGNAQVSGDARVSGSAFVSGNARVWDKDDIGWFSHVGSESGTLTWYRTLDDGIGVTRDCFEGSLEEFRAAVEKKHGDSPVGQQYRLLIDFIKLRATVPDELRPVP